MTTFRDMNAASARKVGRSGHFIADKTGIEWLFSKIEKETGDVFEKGASFIKFGMRQEAANAIAEKMESWDAESFYKAVIAVADGSELLLGIKTNSLKDGVLTSREASRLFGSKNNESKIGTNSGSTSERVQSAKSDKRATASSDALDAEQFFNENGGTEYYAAYDRLDKAGTLNYQIRRQQCQPAFIRTNLENCKTYETLSNKAYSDNQAGADWNVDKLRGWTQTQAGHLILQMQGKLTRRNQAFYAKKVKEITQYTNNLNNAAKGIEDAAKQTGFKQ